MTPQELFAMLMAYPQPTRTEILNHIEEVTRNYEPERVESLLADFADMLFQWQCSETYDRAKREYDERERQHRAEYDERYSAFEVRLNFAEYALAMGTNEPIEWPEEPEPYEPLPFIPPAPWELDVDNVEIPELYNYAVERLESRLDKSRNEYKSGIHESVIFSESQQIIISKAIAVGFMEPTPIGYKWLYGGAKSKVRLAYFLMRLFNDEVPNKEMESVFNVKRIDGALNQARSQKTQDWAYRIEELFP